MVQPFAETAFAAHRAAGRPIVLATTSPYDLVKPFADRLGLDDVVATRYGVARRRHLRRHARRPVRVVGGQAGGDHRVGGPQRRRSRRELRVLRQRVRHADARRRRPSRRRQPGSPDGARCRCTSVADPQSRRVAGRAQGAGDRARSTGDSPCDSHVRGLYPYARFDIDGVDNIPTAGAAILCGNHRSYFDVAAMSLTIAKTRSRGSLPRQEGSVRRTDRRPDRGGDGWYPGRPWNRLRRAARRGRRCASAGGEMVTMMPEGTIPRGPAFFRKPVGRWGAARLAQLSGAPIIPVGSVGDREGVAPFEPGTERPQPRSTANRTSPSRRAGRAPGSIARSRHEADHGARSSRCFPTMRTRRRKPTAEELSLTYPPGYRR